MRRSGVQGRGGWPRPAGVRPGANLVLLIGVLYVASRTSGAGWLVVLMCGLAALVVVAAGWSLVTVLRVDVRILECARDGTAGRPVGLEIEMGPVGPGIEARVTVLGGSSPPVGAGGGLAGRSYRGRITALPARRGVALEAVVELRAHGPLGLWGWRRDVEVPLLGPLEVGPAPAAVETSLPTGREEGISGSRVPAAHAEDLYRGVRDYHPGDPLRLLHWPATAHWDRPMVREVEGIAEGPAVIVVDLRGDPDRAEDAAAVAAGVALSALRASRRVVLHTAEASGPREGVVGGAVEVGRRLARAVTDRAPTDTGGQGVIRVSPATLEGGGGWRRGAVPSPSSAARTRETLVERVRRVNARQPAEESVAVRVAVLVVVLTAALSVLTQPVGGAAFRLLVLAGLPAGMLFSWRTRHRPGFGTKLAVAAGSILALAWFLHTLAGITAGTVADAQAPLAELLLAVQVLQTFDATARRDLVFSVFVSVLVVAAAGILSVSMGLVPFLVVWAVAALAALVLADRRVLAVLPALMPVVAGDPRETGDSPEGGRPGSSARLVAAVLVLTVVVGLGAFVVVPAAGTARALTFPSALTRLVPVPASGALSNSSLGRGDPSGSFAAEARAGRRVPAGREPFGYFGFSTSLDLADRGRPNETLVMRVRAAYPAFWRGQTFDRWDGERWTISDQRSFPVHGPLPLQILEPLEDSFLTSKGPEFVQSYYVVEPGPNLVFGADPVTQLYVADHRVHELSDGTIRSDVELGPGAVYTVVSRPPLTTPALLRAADTSGAHTPGAIVRRYGSALPTTARVRRLAARVTASGRTAFDKVVLLEAWIGAHTRYSLDPPPLPPGADAVDQFLFKDRRGFCEQIATSLVVMLRSLGIPSRLAVGYASGLRNPFTGLFEVHADDAHSWAEVWFPGIGWQPFDPTASVPLAGEAAGSAATGLAAYLSAGLKRLPLPATASVGSGLALGLVGLFAGPQWMQRRRRRRAGGAEPAPSWAALSQERLEAAAQASAPAGVGRLRRPGETLREYLAAVVPPEPRLEHVAVLIDRAAFSEAGITAEEVEWVDGALSDPELLGRCTEMVPVPG